VRDGSAVPAAVHVPGQADVWEGAAATEEKAVSTQVQDAGVAFDELPVEGASEAPLQEAPKNYCAAPWAQGVFKIDGAFLPCCINHTSYGDWREIGSKAAWNGPEAQRFRRLIGAGAFPDSVCRNCYHTNQQVKFDRMVVSAYREQCAQLAAFDLSPANALEGLMYKTSASQDDLALLEAGADRLRSLNDVVTAPADIVALRKLSVIVRSALAYFRAAEVVDYLPLSRLVNLIAICNARCVQCPFLFTGEIIDGVPVSGGGFVRELDAAFLDEAFADTEELTDFFMYGSELLLYRHWRSVAKRLNDAGTRFSLSSNGMTLTASNADYLVENKSFSYLNISVDGATKEVIEDVRKRVKFEVLVKNVKYMLERLGAAEKFYTSVAISFCLMTLNYKDLANIIPFIVDLRGNRGVPLGLAIHHLSIAEFPGPEYQKFVAAHHHSNIPAAELDALLNEVHRQAMAADIFVSFGNVALADYLKEAAAERHQTTEFASELA
jgi:sulfatase maturation enzyme AslB (radical SAM superfamily)